MAIILLSVNPIQTLLKLSTVSLFYECRGLLSQQINFQETKVYRWKGNDPEVIQSNSRSFPRHHMGKEQNN